MKVVMYNPYIKYIIKKLISLRSIPMLPTSITLNLTMNISIII